MDPIIAGLITGGSSILGSMFSSDTSAKNTQAQIQAQQGFLNQTEAYNTQMSNTAYQRASQDMKAAGLNPMMMAAGGMSASSPSISTPSVPMPQTTSPFAGLGQAAGAALNSAVQAKTFDKMTEEISNLQAQQAKTAAETKTEEQRPDLVRQQAFNVLTDTAAKENRMPVSRLEGVSASDILNMPDWLRDSAIKAGFLGRKADDVLSPVISSAGALRPWIGTRSKVQTSHDGDDTFTDRWSGVGGAW